MEIVETSSTDDKQIMDQSHEVSVDINEIATSLSGQLKTKKVFSSKCCIYRVPETLRELNEKAYAPRVVSIGPLHHGKENLKAMEDHKIMYLQQFLERSKVSVEDLINVVRDNEKELRDRYAETIDLSRKDFATMILLDAVFIIIVLLKMNAEGESHESGSADHIFFRPWKLNDVLWDMCCLLENQLPFFILEELLERYSAAGANPRNRTVIELTSQFLPYLMDGWVKEDSWKTINSSEVLHFVDFIRKCQRPTERSSEEREMVILSAPTATDLHQSGVKFKKSGSKLLFDIRFSDGILEIPRLTIHGRTETLLRNLQAFEQCHYLTGDRFVSDYISFISCLVIAPNDVEVLVQNESWRNLLNSNEAASNLINKFRQETYFVTDGFPVRICKDLNLHCINNKFRMRSYGWKATLKMVYFNNPWSGISVVAATFLLILTVIQTVCSILQL